MNNDHASSRTGGAPRWPAALGGLAACAGIALDALAAHALVSRFGAYELGVLATAARYLVVHGLLLLVIVAWRRDAPSAPLLNVAAALAATGIVLFCGGLTARILTGVHALGAAAPYGGTAFMAAWLACGLHGLRHGFRIDRA